MWEKRDAEWARESKARERLMREVCLCMTYALYYTSKFI